MPVEMDRKDGETSLGEHLRAVEYRATVRRVAEAATVRTGQPVAAPVAEAATVRRGVFFL